MNTQLALPQFTAAESFRSALNALSANIAVLDYDGTILAVNQSWYDFARANGTTRLFLGRNYLDVCEKAADRDADARKALAGLKRVAAGLIREFVMEYPCHSPAEQRWFILRVTRYIDGEAMRLVVTHENVTELKLAQEELRRARENLERLVDERTHELSEAKKAAETANRGTVPGTD